MSRGRLIVIAAVIVVFAAVGAALLFVNQGPAPQSRTFDLQVAGSQMTPDKLVANEGDTLTISVTADKAEEIHLHGYDKHFDATPGKPVTMTFTADQTGSFDIEIEDTSTGVGTLQVQPRGGLLGLGR
jgi:hypothetical protein